MTYISSQELYGFVEKFNLLFSIEQEDKQKLKKRNFLGGRNG